jgi:hypothetical protein
MTRRRAPLTEITIVVHGRPLNRNTRYRHWSQRNAAITRMRAHARWCALEQHGAGTRITTPVEVVVVDHCRTANLRDTGNADIKPVVDGLRDAGLIPDDGPEHIHTVTLLAATKTGVDELVITLRTVTPWTPGDQTGSTRTVTE